MATTSTATTDVSSSSSTNSPDVSNVFTPHTRKSQTATRKTHDIMNTNDILHQFGLQTRKSAKDYLAPALGILGAGAAVGAGLSLLLAPKSGKELRGDIKERAVNLKDRAVSLKDSATTLKDRVADRLAGGPNLVEMTREELYEEARELDVHGRSDMTKQELLEAVQSS